MYLYFSDFETSAHTSTGVSRSQALSLTPFASTAPTTANGSQETMWTGQGENEEEEEEEGLGFQRRNAKRGMNFKPLKRRSLKSFAGVASISPPPSPPPPPPTPCP